jgi:hypothetical protein
MSLIAFHNDQKIKDKYLARVEAHRKADEIIKGKYWENGKGCAVGCTVHSDDHMAYETELGIPTWLAKLEDRIFENLSNEDAKLWPEEFLKTINPGTDLEKVKIPFLIFVVESARDQFDHKKFPKQLLAIDGVLGELRKDIINQDKLLEARRAAYAAADAYADYADYAAYAAYAAAYAAADAAYAAAYVAAAADAAYVAAAADAAYAAAAADAAYVARQKAFKKFADKLLELIMELE